MSVYQVVMLSLTIVASLMMLGGWLFYSLICYQQRTGIAHPTEALISIVIGLPVALVGMVFLLIHYFPYSYPIGHALTALGVILVGIAAHTFVTPPVDYDQNTTLRSYIVNYCIHWLVGAPFGIPLVTAGLWSIVSAY